MGWRVHCWRLYPREICFSVLDATSAYKKWRTDHGWKVSFCLFIICHGEIYHAFSIVRRFEQCLREGEVRFNEDLQTISEIVNNYFNVESIVERIRTCQPEDKKSLWTDLKLIGNSQWIELTFSHFPFVSYCPIDCLSLRNLFHFHFCPRSNGPDRQVIFKKWTGQGWRNFLHLSQFHGRNEGSPINNDFPALFDCFRSMQRHSFECEFGLEAWRRKRRGRQGHILSVETANRRSI